MNSTSTRSIRLATLFAASLLALPAAAAHSYSGTDVITGNKTSSDEVEPGAPEGPGLALIARKILTADYGAAGVVNNGVLLVRDGKIEAIGPVRSTPIPSGYVVRDVGDNWLMPGMVEMHCHVAGSMRDINDMVFLTNPGIRTAPTVIPGNPYLDMGLAGGVTSVLYIPGSGTNVGGQGVLLRTAFDTYDEALIRDPGSLKLAQAGNPERWGAIRPGRTFMNYNTRNTFRRGVGYAKRWEAYEKGEGPRPEIDLQFEIFRSLTKNEAQVSTHTQMYQVALMTLTMIHDEMGIPVFIDHGTFDTWRIASLAEERGVYALLGPRGIDVPTRGFINWTGSNPERIQGVAAGFQSEGHTKIGFNTDSPVIPQEELSQQAAVGCRYGFDNKNMDAIRGLTLIPAEAVGLADKIGSLTVGKEADILVVTGDPIDPRTSVEVVYAQGKNVYDTSRDRRRW